jgi:hypothetical protein
LIGLQIRQRLSALDLSSVIPLSINQSLIACVMASKGLGVGLIDPFTPLSGLFPGTHG